MRLERPSPDELDVSYQLQFDDFIAATWAATWARGSAPISGLGICATFALCICVAQLMVGRPMPLICMVLVIGLLLGLFWFEARNGYRRLLDNQRSLRLRLSAEGLKCNDLKSNALVAWETVSAMRVSGTSVLFLTNSGQSVFIPARVLTPADSRLLQEWAEWHAGVAPATDRQQRPWWLSVLIQVMLLLIVFVILRVLLHA